MNKIDILTFIWFIAHHDGEDIQAMEIEDLIKEWEETEATITAVYYD
jgi:hypothetical protein